MGHTLDQWRDKVEALVRDSTNKDLSPAQIDDVGVRPALARYSIDRPRVVHTEVAGPGSPYLALPVGWVEGFSELRSVEHPARQNPPRRLDEQSWLIARSPTDVASAQVLLDRTPSVSEYVRFAFTLPWPFPTGAAGDDPVDDVAFEAVTHLAAANCLDSLAAEAARARMGALPTDLVDGRDRAGLLREAAKAKWGVYRAFLGLVGEGTEDSAAGPAPVSRRMDFDPGYDSLFHGGRR